MMQMFAYRAFRHATDLLRGNQRVANINAGRRLRIDHAFAADFVQSSYRQFDACHGSPRGENVKDCDLTHYERGMQIV